MPSRAYTSFLRAVSAMTALLLIAVSMPSRAYTSFLQMQRDELFACFVFCVNALTGLYLISTMVRSLYKYSTSKCQCPHGLIPHFYGVRSGASTTPRSVCQCPHGLIPHFYLHMERKENLMEKRCQCPHGLIPHFYILHRSWCYQNTMISVNALTGLYLISTK